MVFLASISAYDAHTHPSHLTSFHLLFCYRESLLGVLIAMTSPGYGVCGHKNSFSSGVKIGNYVEDRIGARLAAAMKSHPIARQSEASASFIDPRDMPDKCSANAPPDDPLERALLRNGLPYNLVFEHGRAHLPTREELAVKYTPISSGIGGGLSCRPPTLHQEETRRRQLEIQRAREAREARHSYVTTAQSIVPAIVRPK